MSLVPMVLAYLYFVTGVHLAAGYLVAIYEPAAYVEDYDALRLRVLVKIALLWLPILVWCLLKKARQWILTKPR